MTKDANTLDGLTGLRAVAASWVVAFHYCLGTFAPLGTAHASKLIDLGYLGVDLFFILSGFVIWHVHTQEFAEHGLSRFPRFLCLRAARLYPVHLFTLVLLAVIVWLVPHWSATTYTASNYTAREFVANLLLIQTWGFVDQLSRNYPSWSVSAEWFCYLLFPAAVLLVWRSGRWSTGAGILLLLGAARLCYGTVFDHSLDQAIGLLVLLRAALEFLLGCLLRHCVGQVHSQRWRWGAILLALVAAWAVLFWTPPPAELVALPLFCGLILAAATPNSLAARAISQPVLVTIGAASYSLYLTQAPVQKALRPLQSYLSPERPVQSAAVVAAYLLTIIVVTGLIHRYIETPSRRWLRARIEIWFPHEAAASAPKRAAGWSTRRCLAGQRAQRVRWSRVCARGKLHRPPAIFHPARGISEHDMSWIPVTRHNTARSGIDPETHICTAKDSRNGFAESKWAPAFDVRQRKPATASGCRHAADFPQDLQWQAAD